MGTALAREPGETFAGFRLITPEAPSWRRFAAPWVLARDLWRQRRLVGQFAWRELRGRYQGARLGLAWSLVTPLALLAVYTFVFHFVLQVRWGLSTTSPIEFALTLFCGLLTFQLFAESIQRAPGLVLRHPSFVKRVVFPLQILPLTGLVATLVHFAVGMGLVVVLWSVFVQPIGGQALWLPVLLLPYVALILGVSWFLASAGVFVRDLAPAVIVLCQLLLFATPIFYPLAVVPEAWRGLVLCNPLAVYVENARRVLLWNQPPDWLGWSASAAVSLVVLQAGYVWFMKTKRTFADVV